MLSITNGELVLGGCRFTIITMISCSVQLMVVEKFEIQRVRQSGRHFVIGNMIESSENIVKPCYVNDIDTQTCRDPLALHPRRKVVISSVRGN